MIPNLQAQRWNVGAACIVLLTYIAILCLMPKHVFWSPDEGGKFLELHSIGWHGGLSYTLPYAGQRMDPDFTFYPGNAMAYGDSFPYPTTNRDGTIRFHWPIWFPLISGVMLRAFGATAIYVLPLLCGWLVALLSGRIMHGIDSRLVPHTILMVGLATPVGFYSQCFWDHTPATLLAVIGAAILIAAPPGAVAALLTMAPLLVAAMVLRIEMVAFAAAAWLTWLLSAIAARRGAWLDAPTPAATPIGWRPLRTGRSYLLMLGLAGLAAAALWVVAATGSPRQHSLITTLPARLAQTLQTAPRLSRSVVSLIASTEREEGPAMNRTFVMLTFFAVAACFVAGFVKPAGIEAALALPALATMLLFSASTVFLEQEYRAQHGVFPIAPFMLIWPYAFLQAWRERQPKLLTLACLAALYLLIGCSAIFVFHVDLAGELTTGLEWGQRYLLTLYPLLTILSLTVLADYWESPRPAALRTMFVWLVAVLMILSALQQVRGLAMLHSNRTRFAMWDAALRADGPIVTDLWWLPATLAPLFLTKEMSYVRGPSELSAWARLATAHKTSAFTFVSLGPADAQQVVGFRLNANDSRPVQRLYLTRFDAASGEAPPW